MVWLFIIIEIITLTIHILDIYYYCNSKFSKNSFEEIVETYPNANILYYGTPEVEVDTIICDFSQYKNRNMICVTIYSPEEGVGFEKNQTIYKFKDGTVLW